MEPAMIDPEIFNISEIQLVYRPRFKACLRPEIKNAEIAAATLRQTWDNDTIELLEEFKILLLNTASRLLGICNLSSGGINGTVADPRLILSVALKSAASGIILAHNHPSGNLSPSDADLKLTTRIVEAAKLLEIKVADHIILSAESFYSFAEHGDL